VWGNGIISPKGYIPLFLVLIRVEFMYRNADFVEMKIWKNVGSVDALMHIGN